MTPLEIHLILNLYHSPQPYDRYSSQERHSPAVCMAFNKFRTLGLLADGVTFQSTMIEQDEHESHLSAKGMLLVERLMEVQP